MQKKYQNSSDLNAALTQAVARRKDQQSKVVDPKVRWKQGLAEKRRKRSIIAAAILGPLAVISVVGCLWYFGIVRFGKPSQMSAALAAPQTTLDLNLSGANLVEYPTELEPLVALKSLNLDSNQIATLPATVAALKSLTELSMQYNELSSLPEELGQLEALESLNFRNNRLTALPASLASLKNLQTLDFSNNQLRELPLDIGKLKSLKTLRLRGNQISQLPPSFSNLHALEEIELSGNAIGALPEAKNFPNLRVIVLRGTQVPEATIGAYRAMSKKVSVVK